MPAQAIIPLDVFKGRRDELMRQMMANSIAILPAAPEQPRNSDVDYPFRQDSDFLYLSGFPEPEAIIVLVPGREQGEFILFCREKNQEMETWHGRRTGQEGAVEHYGADDSFPISDIDEILPGLMGDRDAVYYTMGRFPEFDSKLMGWVNKIRANKRAGKHAPHEFVSLEYLLHDMRLYKSPAELAMMRHAATISREAHIRAMQTCQPGLYEYQIEAEFDYCYRRNGASWAYPSIVGGGANSCILHYTDNNQALNDGDLLLIDAGAEWHGYASDVTRTFPVNGRFSGPQRDMYQLVLEAQYAAIAAAKPGAHWDDPHMAAVRVLSQGMLDFGLLRGSLEQVLDEKLYREYYMHRTGHWLGLDVHDVGDYKIGEVWRELEPSMTLTIEPGIYIPAKSDADEHWWNIGIRIEDDVAITETGNEILSADIPKTIDEIEQVMAGA